MSQYDAAASDYETLVVPRMRPVGDDLVARIGPLAGLAVLELAAGTGGLTRLLVPTLAPSGHLIATDVSAAMLSIAAAAVGAPATVVTFLVADMTRLPLLDESFDVVVGRFTPLPDSPPAIREAHRVLRPGGRLVFASWGNRHREQRMLDDVRAECGLPPNPRVTDSLLEARLRRAGFAGVAIETAQYRSIYADATAYLAYCRGFGTPPAWDAPLRRRVWRTLDRALRDRATDGNPIVSEWSIRFVQAVRSV